MYLTESYRFVDRDMVMRYHWGLGVGHLYSHQRNANMGSPQSPEADAMSDLEVEPLGLRHNSPVESDSDLEPDNSGDQARSDTESDLLSDTSSHSSDSKSSGEQEGENDSDAEMYFGED